MTSHLLSGSTRGVGQAQAKPKGWPLPPHPFFAIAAATPVVILAERLYYLAEGGKHHDWLQFEDGRYALVPAQTLAELEHEYFQHHAAELETARTRYMQLLLHHEIRSLRTVQQQRTQQELLRFILFELIPYFQQVETGESKPLVPLVLPEQAQSNLSQGKQTDNARSRPLLVTILGANTLILDEKVYQLRRLGWREIPPDIIVYTPKGRFGLNYPSRPLADVVADFQPHLTEYLKIQAKEEMPKQQALQDFVEQNMALLETNYLSPKIAEGHDGVLYTGKRYAVLRQRGQWRATLQVPAHVLESANGELYCFDAVTIGLTIDSGDDSSPIHCRPVETISPYEHPFVSSVDSYRGVCMVQPNDYQADLKSLPPAHAIAQYLHDVGQTLLTGYHRRNTSQPHNQPSAFPHRQIDRETAIARGLPIYPYSR